MIERVNCMGSMQTWRRGRQKLSYPLEISSANTRKEWWSYDGPHAFYFTYSFCRTEISIWKTHVPWHFQKASNRKPLLLLRTLHFEGLPAPTAPQQWESSTLPLHWWGRGGTLLSFACTGIKRSPPVQQHNDLDSFAGRKHSQQPTVVSPHHQISPKLQATSCEDMGF